MLPAVQPGNGFKRSGLTVRNSLFFSTLFVVTMSIFADNQIIPGNLGTADPAPMVDGETLYLYNTVDAVGNGDLSIYDIHCHSTKDLYHWKDEGVVLNEKSIKWASQIGNLWAPHCIKLGGKYHLYFPANDGRTFRIGHAVSSSPTGPFTTDASYMNGCGRDAIDPFAILDTGDGGSGKAYIAWNQVGTTPNKVYIAELNASYTDVTGTVHEISSGLGSPTRYKEGVWMIKQNKTWYCFIADWTGAVESISYSTSTSLFGPFKKQHDILNQNTNSATIHAGIVPFLNKWLIFYHTGGNEFGKTINSGTKRVTGIEEITFEKTGSIWNIPAVPKTYRGVGVPYSYDTIQIDRHSLSGISGAQIAVVNGGEPRGWMVNRITSGGYIRYNNVNFSRTDRNSGEISLRVASVSSGGSVEVHLDNQTGPLLGIVEIPSTGGLTTWKTLTGKLTTANLPSDSIKNCVLVFKTTAANQYAINWVSIGKEQTTDIIGQTFRNTAHPFSLHRVNQTTFRVYGSTDFFNSSFRLTRLDGTVFTGTATRTSSHSGEITLSFDRSLAQGSYILYVQHKSRMLPMSLVPVFR